jgi:hypothetical protein
MMTPTEEHYEKLLAEVNRESERYNGMHQIAVMEIERLRDVLLEAKLQIDYLHKKFQPTGTGEATVARIQAALARLPDTSGNRKTEA